MVNKVALLCEELCNDQMSSRGPAAAWDYEDSKTFFLQSVLGKNAEMEKKRTSFLQENSGCVLSQYVRHLPDSSQHPS